MTRKYRRCIRKGHRIVLVSRRGFLTDCQFSGWRCVADEISQTRKVCRRCGDATPWETISRTCLQGLSMDASSFDRLKADGEFWC